jgi:hypothetical protein
MHSPLGWGVSSPPQRCQGASASEDAADYYRPWVHDREQQRSTVTRAAGAAASALTGAAAAKRRAGGGAWW